MYITSLLRIPVTVTMRATVSLFSPKEKGRLCSHPPFTSSSRARQRPQCAGV